MGLAIIVKDADFSGIAVGTLQFDTGVGGMTHFYETRVSPEHALVNRVSGLVDADIIGAPVFSATSMVASEINSVRFGFSMGGYETVFVIYKAPVLPDYVKGMIIVGSVQPNAKVRGAAYVRIMPDGVVGYETTVFEGGVFTGTAEVVVQPVQRKLVDMVALTTEDGVGIGIFRPRTAESSKLAFPAPSSLIKPIPTLCRTRIGAGTDAKIYGVMRFNRPLSDAEIETVYEASKRRWGAIGVAI